VAAATELRGIVLDALLGTGLSGDVREPYVCDRGNQRQRFAGDGRRYPFRIVRRYWTRAGVSPCRPI
jgi:hypothetical protein